MAKVLIVEDDDVIGKGMAAHLSEAGFEPLLVGRGEVGLARLRYERPDVVVLDLMLPELDGWEVIERARAEGIGTPILVVSARGTELDRSGRSSSARTTTSSSRSRCASSSHACALPRGAVSECRRRHAAP